MDHNYVVLVSVFFFLLLLVGVFLLFYKRKTSRLGSSELSSPAWLANSGLSPAAKNIHLKELNKQTEKIFTLRWILEYWRGQRSAFYAWFTWVLLGGIAIRASLIPISVFAGLSVEKLQYSGAYSLFIIIYCIFSSIILWRCAKNSTRPYKYFARFIAILPVLKFILDLLSVLTR